MRRLTKPTSKKIAKHIQAAIDSWSYQYSVDGEHWFGDGQSATMAVIYPYIRIYASYNSGPIRVKMTREK